MTLPKQPNFKAVLRSMALPQHIPAFGQCMCLSTASLLHRWLARPDAGLEASPARRGAWPVQEPGKLLVRTYLHDCSLFDNEACASMALLISVARRSSDSQHNKSMLSFRSLTNGQRSCKETWTGTAKPLRPLYSFCLGCHVGCPDPQLRMHVRHAGLH